VTKIRKLHEPFPYLRRNPVFVFASSPSPHLHAFQMA
jgi:hypothetical protein